MKTKPATTRVPKVTDRLPKALDRRLGKLAIRAHIQDGRNIEFEIIGDREGLLKLAEVVHHVALFDMNAMQIPRGARAHIHLKPGCHLIEDSLEARITRADAKDSGKLPDGFDEEE